MANIHRSKLSASSNPLTTATSTISSGGKLQDCVYVNHRRNAWQLWHEVYVDNHHCTQLDVNSIQRSTMHHHHRLALLRNNRLQCCESIHLLKRHKLRKVKSFLLVRLTDKRWESALAFKIYFRIRDPVMQNCNPSKMSESARFMILTCCYKKEYKCLH